MERLGLKSLACSVEEITKALKLSMEGFLKKYSSTCRNKDVTDCRRSTHELAHLGKRKTKTLDSVEEVEEIDGQEEDSDNLDVSEVNTIGCRDVGSEGPTGYDNFQSTNGKKTEVTEQDTGRDSIMIGEIGPYIIPVNKPISKDDPLLKAETSDAVNDIFYSPLMLNSKSSLNFWSDLVKGSQQLASSKQLARVWNSFVLDPSGTHVELNHIAPKLCSKCTKNKQCNEFSSRIQDSEYGRTLELDFADLEEDIIELSRCKTVLKELNENEKRYVENPNRIVCNKFKYFVS